MREATSPATSSPAFRVLSIGGAQLLLTRDLDEALRQGNAVVGRTVEHRHPVYGWRPINPQLRVARERKWRDGFFERAGSGDRS